MSLISEEDLVEVFTDLIQQSIQSQRIKLDAIVEAYLVRTVCELSSISYDNLARPVLLPDLLRSGLNSQGAVRREYLRVVGDVALLVSGIFPDSLDSRRHWYSLSDVIAMGQKAYGHMDAAVFDELSRRFPELVEVLNVVGEKINLISTDLRSYIARRKSLDSFLISV